MKPISSNSLPSRLIGGPTLTPSVELSLKCTHEKSQFTDPKFQPNLISLIGPVKPPEYNHEWDVFQWKRPEQIWQIGTYQFSLAIHPSQIRPGFLNDNYFLSAVAILAEHPFLISRLFTNSSINPTGVYGVWLHINGVWTEVVVDDLIPTFTNEKGLTQFAFSHSPNEEFWLQILEKAYAKAYGSYYTISGGTLSLALNDLTGAPTEVIKLGHGQDAQNLWKKIETFERKGCLLAFNIKPNHVISQTNTGLKAGMGYKILAAREVQLADGSLTRIVKIRSNWDKVNIDKLWPESKTKWSPKLKEALGELSSPDGSFWIPYSLAQNYFDEVVVCRLMPDNFFACSFISMQKYNISTLWLSENVVADISVIQEDLRSRRKHGETNLKYHFCRMTVLELTQTGFRFVRSIFGNERSLSFNDNFTAGNYIILVEFYLPLYTQPTEFSVEIYSSSSNLILCPLAKVDPQLFQDTEIEAWRSYADKEAPNWRPQSSESQFRIYLQKHDEAYLQLEVIGNVSNPPATITYERGYHGEGIEVSSNIKNADACILRPAPGHHDVAVIKHNPLSADVDFTVTGYLPVVTAYMSEQSKSAAVRSYWASVYELTKTAKLEEHKLNDASCGSKCALI